ncbi:MAG: hypothetical protein EHM45_02470 [Desulfobacteraceae bacterium]|nr:MAG: hypothetical protein EHM45_02470 [Desulfobacteraceae bacterium]
MEKMIEILFYKLGLKGLQPLQIPGFVRNVLRIIVDGRSLTTDDVNQKLKHLGWGEEVIDGSILELIVGLFENEDRPAMTLSVFH